jgi:hypothetical protein
MVVPGYLLLLAFNTVDIETHSGRAPDGVLPRTQLAVSGHFLQKPEPMQTSL